MLKKHIQKSNRLGLVFNTHSSHLEHAFWQHPHSDEQHERQQFPIAVDNDPQHCASDSQPAAAARHGAVSARQKMAAILR